MKSIFYDKEARSLASFIRDIREEMRSKGDSVIMIDEKLFACMTSVIIAWRDDTLTAKQLAFEIWEHG